MGFEHRVSLGSTGLRVSRLGLGAFYGLPARAVERAFHEHGVNYLYWGSAPREGMGLAIRHLGQRYRDDLVVALHTFDRSGLALRSSVRASLCLLGLQRADLLILTLRDTRPGPRVMDAAQGLVADGVVGHLGISSHNRSLLAELARSPANPFGVFMLRYNAAHRGAEREIFPFLPVDGRPGVVAFTATRWGHLIKSRWMPPGEAPLSAADCYRFVLSNPAVDLCLTGPADQRQMEQGLEALQRGPLDAQERERVERIGAAVYAHKGGFSVRRAVIESRLARWGRDAY